MRISVKRVYEPACDDDGVRILVDRLWPRGLTKAQAKIDVWVRDAAPSMELRRWFNHEPEKWNEFKRRYFEELRANESAIKTIRENAAQGTVTLLFAAKDSRFNNAMALRDYLMRKAPKHRA